MKKTAAPQQESTSTALTVPAMVDELAGIEGIDFGDDGLSEAGAEDWRIPSFMLNMNRMDANGRAIPKDMFFNTVDETTVDTIDAALFDLHKTNLWSVFDNEKNRNDIMCRSYDRLKGVMKDGTIRPCKGCPDAQWTSDSKGKPTRNCGPVYNLFGIDRRTGQPFVFRAKRTSLKPAVSYLQKHFIMRRTLPNGEIANYPLYAFQTTFSAVMHKDGKYSLPVLNRGDVLSPPEMKRLIATKKTFRENMEKILTQTEDASESQAADATPEGGDTSFDPDKFGGQEGKDFKE